MGEEAELSTDSFVDTVANTVGVLIILTVVMIATSQEKVTEVTHKDKDLAELREKRKDVHGLRAESRELDGLIAEREREFAALAGQEEAARTTVARAEKIRDELKGQLETARKKEEGLTLALDQLGAERRGYEETLRAADEEDEKARAEFSDADLALLARQDPAEIDAAVAKLAAEESRLSQEAADAERQAADVEKAAADLQKVGRELQARIEELSVRGVEDIVIHDPTARPDYSKLPVLFECYLAAGAPPRRGSAPADLRPAAPSGGGGGAPGGKPAPSVRDVSPENYVAERKGRGKVFRARPGAVGEDAAALARPGSRFSLCLSRQDKDKRYVLFLVRPDAYSAFNRAAEVAAKAGWEVRWDPIPAGKDLVLGGTGGG